MGKRKDMPIWLSILVVGFIAGMFFAIGIETGISPDERGVSIFIMKTFCKEIQSLGQDLSYSCNTFLVIMIILSIFLGIIAVLEEANRMDNWKVGLAIYVIGWITGLVYMLTH